MKGPNNLVRGSDPRVWINIVLEVAKYAIPVIQRELHKRWKKARK